MNAIAKPFGMLLMLLYQLLNNYGWAILLFAIVVRGILLPFQMKSKRGTMRTARLQPRLQELQKKHGANKTKLNEETAKLYKEEGVNPASGCLWGLLPFPIMIALFMVIRQPLTLMLGVDGTLLEEGGAIFEQLARMNFTSTVSPYYIQMDQARFISAHFDAFKALSSNLRVLDFSFLGLNLGTQPEWNFLWKGNMELYDSWLSGFVLFLLPLISGAMQLLSSRISQKMNPVTTPDGQGGSMQVMMMLMPLVSVYFAFITPAALGLYWTFGSILQIGQDIWLTKRYTRIMDAEDAVKNEERKIKEAELEAKRLETERKKAEGIVERNPNTSKRKKQKTEKQETIEKAVEWEKRKAPPAEQSPSRVGDRRYARGRAYDPDRYSGDEELMGDAYVQARDSDDENGAAALLPAESTADIAGADEGKTGKTDIRVSADEYSNDDSDADDYYSDDDDGDDDSVDDDNYDDNTDDDDDDSADGDDDDDSADGDDDDGDDDDDDDYDDNTDDDDDDDDSADDDDDSGNGGGKSGGGSYGTAGYTADYYAYDVDDDDDSVDDDDDSDYDDDDEG